MRNTFRNSIICEHFSKRKLTNITFRADLFSPEQLQLDVMEFELDPKQHLVLTDEDITQLKDLKIRQLEQFTPEQNEKIGLSMVDILFGFHYNFRTTLVNFLF